MTDAAPGPDSTIARRQLGRYLKAARKEARLTVEAAAKALEWGETKMWKIETGQSTTIRTHDVEAMCRVYGVPTEHVRVLGDLAKQSKADGWWPYQGTPMSPGFQLYLALEGAAAELRWYESELVPGLLQTPEYARALVTSGVHGGDPAMVERIIELRMARQTVLTRVTAPPTLVVVLNEAVLRRPVGDRQVMRGQLDRLVEVSELPNVTVHVVPFSFGPHPGLHTGPFVLLRFPPAVEGRHTEPPVVYVEALTGSLILDVRFDVEQYGAAFAGVLDAIGGDVARSTGFLREAARELHG